jgi:hypothetical protein
MRGGAVRRHAMLVGQVNSFANLMVRVLHERNYGVYVNDARSEQHHLPHAHILHRRSRVGSVFLWTLEYYMVLEQIPGFLREAIAENQERLLEVWEELNPHD